MINLNNIKQPLNFPKELFAIVEISANSYPVKYEIDSKNNFLHVDRFIPVSMNYPCNYAFLPNITANDGDFFDTLVVTRFPVMPFSVIKIRPIGFLEMSDEAGEDHKIISVPALDVDPFYSEVHEATDLPSLMLDQIRHFFEHYKDLEPNKNTNIGSWKSSSEAMKILKAAYT